MLSFKLDCPILKLAYQSFIMFNEGRRVEQQTNSIAVLETI